ncbi:MAG: hypothetical protein Q8941_09290 [Bacteroidota bacterium]|nr:hypothetical protein [Bacteroidota bacterium]
MKKHPDINEKVEEALNSLEGIQKAELQPYFYTRLTARLQRNEKTLWERMGSFLAKPAVAGVCLCVILVFNAFILFRHNSGAKNSLSIAGTQNEQIITDNEYILASGSSFDYENFDQQ